MDKNEQFSCICRVHIQVKGRPDLQAKVEIEATSSLALEKSLRDILADDRHGVLRDIFTKALLTSPQPMNRDN